MSQPFDYLNTGNSGVSTFGNEEVSTEQDEVVQEQQLAIEQLLPSVRQILDVIDEEIASVADIRAYMSTLGEAPDVLDIQAEYRGRELYVRFLQTMKSNITTQVGDVLEEN